MNPKYLDILAEFYRNPLFFAQVILSKHFYLTPALFHIEIFNLLEQRKQYNCIVAPRDHSKSTLISLAYVLHQILFKRAKFCLIISDTATQAELFLDAIKNELESNDILKELFGDLRGEKWTTDDIELKNGTKIIARGAKAKIRGLKWRELRPDLIICDDMENDELVKNQDRRKEFKLWFYSAVLPALATYGRLIIIGTILHYDSLLNSLSRDVNYARLFYQAITKDGKALWKWKFTIEKLLEIKEKFKAQGLLDAFQTEYMNEPISDENAIFKKKWFKYYQDNDIFPEYLSKFITVDLAISEKESADYTVILVTGIDEKKNIYVLEYERDRFTPIETIELIFKLAKKWKVMNVGVESVAYQRSLIWFLEDEMRRRNEFLLVQELKADTDKERRIRGLQPRYAVGTVFHKPQMTALEEELLLFPKAPHDDIADALAYVPQIAFPGKATSEPYKPQKSEREQARYIYTHSNNNDFSSL